MPGHAGFLVFKIWICSRIRHGEREVEYNRPPKGMLSMPDWLKKRTLIASCVLALGILLSFTAIPVVRAARAQSSISLDVRNADLVDVLRMLAQIEGLNVIISSEVKGTVTVQLSDVSAKDAFETLLDTAGLVKVQKGSVIGILPRGTLLRQEQQREQARRLTPGDFRTEVIKLDYAKATELAKTLASFLSPWGSIAADRRTNSLIIRDVSESAIFNPLLTSNKSRRD
jgi:type II secretory pathway component HofQ